ncbi:MAG: hypothetical protein IT314_08085 [Anaerolineales bacterium]|nr:hypothetical protein [Anaerolineales bacterium]
MYSVDWVLDKIKNEKSKSEEQEAFFLDINTVLGLCGKVLLCTEHAKLVDGIQEETCDEDLITFYFTLPFVASSMKIDDGDYSDFKSLIEAKIPEINSVEWHKAKEKLDRLVQLTPEQLRFITEKELYSLDADVIVTRMSVESKIIQHNTQNSEYFWWLRERLCANRRFQSLHNTLVSANMEPRRIRRSVFLSFAPDVLRVNEP